MLLCAEEDDLDLVALVHMGRQRGLELEVRPGVEHDDGPLLCALDDTPRALLVLIRSDNLPAERALALKSTFELTRTEEQDLIAVKFDPARVATALELIARRLEQLGPDPALADVVFADAATAKLTPLGMPINVEVDADIDIDLDESSSAAGAGDMAEFEVTIRQSIEHTGASPAEPREPDDPELGTGPRSRSRGRLLAGVLALGGLAAAATYGAMTMSDDPPPEVAPAPAAVEVEVRIIEAPVPEPAPVEPWRTADAPPEVAPTPLAEPIEGTPPEEAKKQRHRRRRRR